MMKENIDESLSPTSRLYQLPSIDNYIITMIGFKAKIKLELILDDLKHNVSKLPRFCSKLSDDGERWMKIKVNVEDHVYAPDIDSQEIKEDGQGGGWCNEMSPFFGRWNVIDVPLGGVYSKSIRSRGLSYHSYVVQFSASVWFLKDTETPLKQIDGFVENNPKRFYHRTVSLDDIRLIKNAMNMTINDVLFGVTQTALSRYLNGRYGKSNVEGGTSSDLNHLPGKIRFRAGFPVNLRQEIGIKPVADMLAKGSKCRWGNYIVLVHFPLSISLETDPLVHLSKTKAIMDRKKHSRMAALFYSINKFITSIFGPKVASVFFERSMLNTTTLFSNIIGPVEEISLHGNQITYIALSSYGNIYLSQALMIHFISYAEKMIISIAVDPAVIPDHHNLCDEMEKSLKAIKDTLFL
ncbi:hypothetical protein AALP_AA7G224600 [Arabis alpina]|uniref:O-acyltransferase WSD1 C-terminal domain-containing protein n=1 Tax=Arabis alpina TaxID=50452 RepID=A0A087GJV6_ARAAL|nr:hypothetical protein AALP_AA7G224600 [Arabis alpina]